MEESEKMKPRKLLSILSILVVLSMVLVACGPEAATPAPVATNTTAAATTGDATPTTAGDTGTTGEMVDTSKFKKDGPYKIGFSNISVVNSWRVQMVRELEYEKSLHPEISDLFITDAGGDINKQIADIEDLLARGVDALLVTPTSPEALVPVVQKALDKNIPIIVFNSALAGNIETAFVGTDEVEFGYVISKWLMEQLNCQGDIIALDGIAGNSISEDRFKGLQNAINECSDPSKVKILSREAADWARDKGKIATEKALAAYPKIDGVWSQGGAMTQGAMEAFQAANRPLVPMTGEDNNGFMKMWKQLQPEGFKGIAASEPTWISAEALKLALDALNGKSIPKLKMIPVPTITEENLDEFVKPNLSDEYWTNSKLPPELAEQYYGTGTTSPEATPTPGTGAAAGEQVDTSKFKKDGPYKIGFSNISVVNSWRVQMVRELEYEKSLHPEISDLFITDAGGDINKQIADIEDLLARGVDALLVTPTSPEALVPVIQKALDKNIPIIVFNSALAGNIETAFVGTDEVEFGYVISKWLMEQLNCQGDIIALDGIAGNSISEDRFKGLEKAIGECPDPSKVKILSREAADWARDKGKIATEKALAAYPKIDGVWSQGGAMTQGAMEAFQAANRPLVPMTGEDNNGFMKMWKQLQPEGFKGIAASEPTWISAEALKLALDALNGKSIPKSKFIPVPTITEENLDEFVKPDLSDEYWTNSKLPADVAKQYYGK
jgi:ribose transport system substrate-binding protein